MSKTVFDVISMQNMVEIDGYIDLETYDPVGIPKPLKNKEVTLGSRCFQLHKAITTCIEEFSNSGENLKTLQHVSELLFQQVMNFLNLLSTNDTLYLDAVSMDLELYWSREMNRKYQEENSQILRNLMMVTTVSGFCKLHKGQFEMAVRKLESAIQMIESFKSSFTKKESYLRIINLLCAHSLMLMDNRQLDKIDNKIEMVLFFSKNIDTEEEQESGRLEYYFQITGFLLLEKAILQKPKLPSKKFLYEFIRKFVILSTLKLRNDSSIGNVFNLLLCSMCLYGGVSVRTFWFFKLLKKFFLLEQSCYQTFFNNYLFSRLGTRVIEMFTSFLEKIHQLENSLTEREKETLINNTFCLPDMKLDFEDQSNLKIDLPYNHMQSIFQLYTNNLEDATGEEFVFLWLRSFKDHNRDFPSGIVEICFNLGFNYNPSLNV